MLLPRYRQIRAQLVEQIRTGVLRPGDRVESENELGARFGVSRLTVQRAMRDLVAEGLLRRVQGSGTFVSEAAPGFPLVEVRDLAAEIRTRGATPGVEVLLHRRERASPEDGALLGLEAEAALFRARLLVLMDGRPLAIEDRCVRPDVYPDFLEQDFTTTSIFAYLAARSKLEDIETVVSAILPDARTAQLLEVGAGEPCLHVRRRNWWRGTCVTVTRFTYAGQRQILASRYRPIGEG